MSETIGQRIKRLRRAAKLTQDQLAEKINANRVTVAKYEKDAYRPSSEASLKIAQALNTTTDYLLGNEEAATQTISDDDIKFALFGADPHNITDAQFEEVKRFAQFLVEREANKKHDK